MEKIVCTEEHKELIFQIPLFRDLPQNVKSTLLDRLDYQVFHVEKKDEIARQGTPCKRLYVLLKGKLRADIIDGSGNEVMIEYIIAPRAFATPHLFNTVDNRLPVTFTALEESVLFTASKESTFKLISEEPSILRSFLCITGNCNKCTVSRLNVLAHKNVRDRFVAYLFEHKRPGSSLVQVVHNQVQLAEYLNVTRPALSKEINKMVKEGMIKVEGKTVELLRGNYPETYLL
ncbi:cyclic nucleotide-binding domain-containing protein [Bacteroidaceae bacterium]